MKAADYCADIAKALEMGPTEGEWRDCGGHTPAYGALHSKDGYIIFGYADSTVHTEHGKPIHAPDMDRQSANRKFIAACHPAALRSILEEREQSAIAFRIKEEECERLRAQNKRLRDAGALLSNIAFNLAQCAGQTIDSGMCLSMDQSRKRWDAAMGDPK